MLGGGSVVAVCALDRLMVLHEQRVELPRHVLAAALDHGDVVTHARGSHDYGQSRPDDTEQWSALGATSLAHMAYMERLGLWGEETPFPKFGDFQKAAQQLQTGVFS